MDNHLLYAVITSIFYLVLDFGKHYCTKKDEEYNIINTIPVMIIVFICTLVYFTYVVESNTPSEKVLNEPWE